MNVSFYKSVVAVALGFGLLFMSSIAAGDTNISLRYAGTGFDSPVDTNADNFTISLDQARAKGTFGNSTIAITAEFAPTGGSCSEEFPDEFYLVFSAAVITFPDLSQLFGIALPNDGMLCLNQDTGRYHGYVEGLYVDGAGRFKGASGDFSSSFEGQFLDVSVGFRSINGTVEGSVRRR